MNSTLQSLKNRLLRLSVLFTTFAWIQVSGNTAKAQSNCFPAPQEIIQNSNGEAAGYNLVYQLSLPQNNPNWEQQSDIPYSVNNSAALNGSSFTRIAYYMKLQSAYYGEQWVWVSMDAFTNDLGLVGIPTGSTIWQQKVSNMNIYANSVGTGGTNSGSSLATGTGFTGNIEFWSHAYSPANSLGIPGASDDAFDFGDVPDATQPDVYGSFQIHNYSAQQTVLAYNGWSDAGESAEDLGIGTQLFDQPDWTFARNSIFYDVKELYVFVNSSCCNGLSVTASAAPLSCNNGTTTIAATATGGNGHYTYRLNNGPAQTDNTFTVGAGTYTITVESNGCSATSNTIVLENPSPIIVTASAEPILCNGATTTLTISAQGGANDFTYSINGQPAKASNTFEVGAGSYSITVTDANGCSASTSINISQPAPLAAVVSAGTIACNQTTTTLTVNASGGTGTRLYSLNNGAFQQNNVFTVGAGTHTITVKDANGCTFTISKKVDPAGGFGFLSVTIPDEYAVKPGGKANTLYLGYGSSSLVLTADVNGGNEPYSYQWSTGETTESITVSPNRPGLYLYIVTVKDAGGCKVGVALKFVHVEDIRCGRNKVSICHKAGRRTDEICVSTNAVAAHLAHGDVLGDCYYNPFSFFRNNIDPGTSTAEPVTELPSSVVYPNPTSGKFQLHLSLKQAGEARVEIVNASGLVIERKNVQVHGNSQKVDFDLSRQAAGIYLVRVSDGTEVHTYKVLLQK